jgi:hypothetical protein
MESERLIASLYARRRRLILGLKDFERRAEVYRSAIMALESKLQALRPSVPAFKPHRPSQYFTPREFTRGYHDAVREAEGKILTVDDVVIFLMRSKGLNDSDTVMRKTVRRRVLAMRRRMCRTVQPVKLELAANSRKNRQREYIASPD